MSNDKKAYANVINELSRILKEINWCVAIPDQNSIDHLLIGKDDKLEELASDLPYDYEILTKETHQ